MTKQHSVGEHDIESENADSRSVLSEQTTPPATPHDDEHNLPDPLTPPHGNTSLSIRGEAATSANGTEPIFVAVSVPAIDSLKATPPKARVYSTGRTRDSIYAEIEADLKTHFYGNIDIEVFLKLCMGLDESVDIRLQLEHILDWGVHIDHDYELAQKNFRQHNIDKEEIRTYEFFIKMGNMFLERAEQEGKSDREVRLLDHHNSRLEDGCADRRPDIVLVPKTVAERVTRKKNEKATRKDKGSERRHAAVPEVLVPFEMKVDGGSGGGSGTSDVGKSLRSESVLGKRCYRNAESSTQTNFVKRARSTIEGKAIKSAIWNLVQPKGSENPDVQLASYAIELMSYRGDRSYTFGVKVKGASVTIFLYHRSAIFASKEFDFLEHPEYLAFFLLMFTRDPTTYGFNKNMGYKDPFDLENSLSQLVDIDWMIDLGDIFQNDNEGNNKSAIENVNRDLNPNAVKKMVLKERVVCHYCLIGRGTSVIEAEIPAQKVVDTVSPSSTTSEVGTSALGAAEAGPAESSDLRRSTRLRKKKLTSQSLSLTKVQTATSSVPCGLKGKNADLTFTVEDGPQVPQPEQKKYVFKFSWQVETREAEIRFLIAAGRCLPDNVPKVYGYAVVKDNTPARSFIEYCRTTLGYNCDSYEKREMRVLVMDYFEGLDLIEDEEIFQELMYQCMDCLHILYKDINLLHRDISYGNIAFIKKDDCYIVIILDFDLAVFVDRKGGTTSNHRTGTAPFMSRELLYAFEDASDYIHDIKHDLESVYDLMVWHGTKYRSILYPEKDPLKAWRKGTHMDMRSAKQNFFTDNNGARYILTFVDNEGARREIERIRRAYRKEIVANIDKGEELARESLEQRAREEGTKAMEAFLQVNPSLKRVDHRARLVYKKKVTEIEASGGEIKQEGLIYRGISYKTIMEAVDRHVEEEHRGCKCC